MLSVHCIWWVSSTWGTCWSKFIWGYIAEPRSLEKFPGFTHCVITFCRPGAASGLPEHTYEVDTQASSSLMDEEDEEAVSASWSSTYTTCDKLDRLHVFGFDTSLVSPAGNSRQLSYLKRVRTNLTELQNTEFQIVFSTLCFWWCSFSFLFLLLQRGGVGGPSDKKEGTVVKEGWLTKTPFFDSHGFAALTMRVSRVTSPAMILASFHHCSMCIISSTVLSTSLSCGIC